MAGIPTDGIGHYAHIVAKREGLADRLSPGARHQALPTLYAKPVPLNTSDVELRAEIIKLGKEVSRLCIENDRLKAENARLQMLPAIIVQEFAVGRTPGGLPRVKDLVRIAARVSGASPDAILGPTRARHIAYPRHFAIWLAREIRWDLSLPQLGAEFYRDHTTIMHALKNVAKYREDAPFRDWIADRITQETIAVCKEKGEGAC